jgi:hypothetical protein
MYLSHGGGQRRSYIQLFFLSKFYNGGNFYTILTTNLYDKSQTKVPYGLVCTIYIDNIQKAVIICLIISTFPFDADPGWTTYVIHTCIFLCWIQHQKEILSDLHT